MRRARRRTPAVATGTPAAGSIPKGSRSGPRKIGALGIRVQRGVTFHGIALNVTTDLRDFDLIDPCGMPGVTSTSIAREAGRVGRAVEPSSVERAARRVRRRADARASTRRPALPRRGGLRPWRPACSSSARTPITGWWVATVVDRAFHRDRFRLAAEPVQHDGECRNCVDPPGDGVRVRMLKDFAFHVVGTEAEARDAWTAGWARSRSTRRGRPAAGRRSSRPGRASAAPRGRSVADRRLLRGARDMLAKARAAGTTEYVQVVQNWGAQAGARTNHLCLDVYDLPQVPHRVAEELGGAARFVIREGECPFCRLVRDELGRGITASSTRTRRASRSPRIASRSPFEVWVVPRHHAADFASRHRSAISPPPPRRCAQVLARLATLDGPPYNLVLHTAPLRESVETTFHWHWEIHPRLRAIAGLELGSGLPVNPVSPEEAVEELLRESGLGAPVDAVDARLRTDPSRPMTVTRRIRTMARGSRRHIAPGRIVPNHASQGCAAQRSRACDDRAVTGCTWFSPTSRSAGISQ